MKKFTDPTPLNAPRPAGPANRALVEHQEVLKRQSDHEIKVDGTVEAMALHLKKREAFERDIASAVAVLAHELGASEKLPESLRTYGPPPPGPSAAPEDGSRPSRAPGRRREPPTVHENALAARRAAQGGLLLLLVEIAVYVVRHIP